MTGETPDWEPYKKDWAQQEVAMTNCRGHIQSQDCNDIVKRGQRIVNSVSCNYQSVNITDNQGFVQELERHVQVCRVKTSGGWRTIDADALAKKWVVSTDIAWQTLARPTRRGICTLANSTLSHWFSTNDQQMCYKHLHHDLYTDTMKASTPLHKKDLYAQVFCTNFRWSRAFLMKIKSKAVYMIDLLFHRDGMPTKLIMDGSKEQTLGQSRKSANKQVSIWSRQRPTHHGRMSLNLQLENWRKQLGARWSTRVLWSLSGWIVLSWRHIFSVKYFLGYLQDSGWNPWDPYVWWNIWYQPVLQAQFLWMGCGQRQRKSLGLPKWKPHIS